MAGLSRPIIVTTRHVIFLHKVLDHHLIATACCMKPVAAIKGVIGVIYPPPLESWGKIPLPRILGVITPEHIFRP